MRHHFDVFFSPFPYSDQSVCFLFRCLPFRCDTTADFYVKSRDVVDDTYVMMRVVIHEVGGTTYIVFSDKVRGRNPQAGEEEQELQAATLDISADLMLENESSFDVHLLESVPRVSQAAPSTKSWRLPARTTTAMPFCFDAADHMGKGLVVMFGDQQQHALVNVNEDHGCYEVASSVRVCRCLFCCFSLLHFFTHVFLSNLCAAWRQFVCSALAQWSAAVHEDRREKNAAGAF